MTDQEMMDRAVQLMLDDRFPADAARHLRHLADLCDKQGVLAKYLPVRDLLIASARLCERERAMHVLRDRVEDVAGRCAASWVQDDLRAALALADQAGRDDEKEEP